MGLLGVLLPITASLASPSRTPQAEDSPPADVALLEGLTELHQGRFSRGQWRFRSFLEAHPADPRGHLFLAFCEWWKLLQVGAEVPTPAMEYHLEEAVRLAQAQADRAPEDPEALASLGTAYIFLAQHRAAEKRFFKAASAARRAKATLEKAALLRPDLVDSRFGLGAYNYYADKVSLLVKGLRSMLFLPGGDSEKGLLQLNEVAERGRYFRTEAHLLLAIIYQGRHEQRYRAALDHLQAALELNPDSPIVLGSLGELQMRLGAYPESHAVLQRAIARCEVSGDREQALLGRILRILLADSLDLSLHNTEAMKEIGSALPGPALHPDWRKRLLAVATRSALRVGDTESLEKIFAVLAVGPAERESLLRRHGSTAWINPALVRSLAPALARLEEDRAEAALPVLEALISTRPEAPELLFHRGRLAFQLGRWAEARSWLARIPDSPLRTAPWVLGWKELFIGRCGWELGEIDAAKESYRRALEVDGFRGKDLARELLGPEGSHPHVWPREVFASGLQPEEDPLDVAAGLLERRDAPVAVHGFLTGIVGGKRESGVAVSRK